MRLAAAVPSFELAQQCCADLGLATVSSRLLLRTSPIKEQYLLGAAKALQTGRPYNLCSLAPFCSSAGKLCPLSCML